MATSSLLASPVFTFSLCQMFSYTYASFSDNRTYNKCSLNVVLEARLPELKARLCTSENHSIASQVSLPSVEPPGVAHPISTPPAGSLDDGQVEDAYPETQACGSATCPLF